MNGQTTDRTVHRVRERGLRKKRDGLKGPSESSLMFLFLDWPGKERLKSKACTTQYAPSLSRYCSKPPMF